MFDFAQNVQKGLIYLFKSSEDFHFQIVDLIKRDYFEYDTQNNIFDIVRRYVSKYKTLPTDDIILEEAKKRVREANNQYPKLSDYKDEIDDCNRASVVSYANKQYYLDLIEEFAKDKAMEEALKKSITCIRNGQRDDVVPLLQEASKVSLNVQLGDPYFYSFKDRWHNDKLTEKLSTFLPSLDRNMGGGLSKKELNLIISPPGIGKSLSLVNLGKAAMMQNKKVLHISLEMSDVKTGKRYDSIITGIPYDRIKHESKRVLSRLELFRKKFPGADLVIKEFPTRGASVSTIRALLTQLKNKQDYDPDVILVDYLELLNPGNESLAEHQAQQRIAEDLRGIAGELNKWLITVTQTNRLGSNVEIITDTHIADSYGKYRVADLAISLNQVTEEYNKGVMRAYVMKARDAKQKYIIRTDICYDTLVMYESENQINLSVDSSEQKLATYLESFKS